MPRLKLLLRQINPPTELALCTNWRDVHWTIVSQNAAFMQRALEYFLLTLAGPACDEMRLGR